MTVLEQIRLENPSLALVPDDELIEKLLLEYQGDLDPEIYRQSLMAEQPAVVSPVESPTAGRRPIGVGSSPQDIGYGEAFTSGLKSMWQRTWGPGVNYLKGGIAGLFGDEDTAQRLYQEAREQDQEILNRTGYVTFEQATKGPDAGIDTFVKFGLQQAGMSLPYTLFGGVGGIAGRALLGQTIGKTAATMTGATATFLPTTAQFNIARQVEEVERGNLDEVNEAAAFGAALPSAILESALYPVLGRLFGPLSRTQFSNVISRATLGRVAKGSATGAVTEAITEVGQQAIERFQAGLPIDSPDAINEYKEAAAGAAFVGGLFGGATTTAGEIARTVQPTPTDAPVTQPTAKPVEAPKVEAGIIQPQQQKDRAKEEAAREQAKPASFAVQQEGDKFVVKSQELDANNNVIKTDNQGVFNTQAEATAKQQEIQDQKNKLPEQTFFTADEIKTQDPTLGSIIDEVESQGAKISPGTKQVYYRKDLALPQGDLTNVMNSGGTAGSVADGWYDRTSDLAYISLTDLGKVKETVAHENFHALQRVTDRVSPNLFTEQEQTALDTFLPGGTIDSITPNVQKALGNDVMNTLRERHADRNISNREMQAYAFGAYATLRNNNKLLSAPNPVIRAFRKLFDFIKRAGNIFRKNKINDVKDIFDKARLGDIGKRAKPQPDVDALRTKSLAQAEKAAAKGEVPTKFEFSLTDLKYGDRTVGTILPFLDARLGRKIFEDIYNNPDITKPRIKARFRQLVRPEQGAAVDAIVDIGTKERELIDEDKFIEFRIQGTNETVKIGSVTSRRSAVPELKKDAEGRAELKFLETQIAKVYKRAPAEGAEFALSTVKFREKPPKKLANVKQAGKFFDSKVKKSDPLDDAAYNEALDAAEEEIKYQIKIQEDDGRGWYDEDVKKKFKILRKKITIKGQYDKDLFTIITGITSPQSTPVENVDRAGRVYSYYKKFGAIPLKQPSKPDKFFGRDTISKQLALLQYLIDTKGEKGAVRFLNSRHTKETMDNIKRKSGQEDYGGVFNLNYGKDAEVSDMLGGAKSKHFGAYMFGNKVGSYFLNISGVADKEGLAVTKDLWASRSFYRQFGMLTDKTNKNGLREDFLSQHIKRGDQFFNDLGKRTGLSAKDAQAVLWFYEHNLYRDLGIKTVPALYLSQGAEKYINNFDKGENYGQKELRNRRKSVESQARLRRQKDAERAEETELSVDQEKIQRQIKNVEVPSFSLSAGEKTFKDLVGFAPETKDGMRIIPEKFNVPLRVSHETDNYVVAKNVSPGYTFLFIPKPDGYKNLADEEKSKALGNVLDESRYSMIELNPRGKEDLDLSAIGVPEAARGQGIASDALKEILAVADKNKARITATIQPFGMEGGLGVKALKNWYFKEGFRFRDETQDKRVLKGADIVRDPQDESAISADFSRQQFDEADSVQFSVSDKMLTDKEIQDSTLPSNVKAKLFENRKLKDGTPVSIRPNLNGQVVRDDKKLFVQTIHPGKNLSKALGYDGAVRVTDPLLNVSQKARANIASKRQNKFPMAAAQGKLSKKKATLEGQVLNFNPFQHHLFVDPAGYAVKSIKGDAVMFNTKVYTTGTLNYYSRENAPTPLENIESNVLYKYETEAEKRADQPLETDTLSKEKLREFNLEFSASTRKFSDGTQRVLNTINPKQSRKTVAAHWKDFTDNWGVKFQQGLSDQYISVKKFVGEEEYKSLTMTYGSSGATEAALLYGVPFMDNMGAIDLKDKTIGTGLFTRFEKLGQDLPDFLAWVAANRARNLVNKGFESGLGNINDINTAIKELQQGKEKQFNESLKDLQEFNKAFLDIGVKSGYIDPASAKVWTEDNGYNFYIPFYRLLEDRDSNSGPRAAADIVNQPDYPRFRGADLPVNDLLQNIIRNYSFLTEASLKNAAGLKTLRKAAEMGVARRVPNKTKTSVFVRDKGKMEHYEVDNKLVLESLTALNWNGWQNPAMNIMRNFKRYLTYGVTFSPAFRIRNLLRDSIHSVAVGKLKYNPMANVLEGIQGLKKNKQLGASELRARMAFGGGSIHFGHIYGDDPNATKMLLDRAIDVNTVMERDGWSAGARRVLNSKLRNSLKWWEETGSFFENVNRAALYKQLRAKGVSHFEAAYQARDLLNFSRHGANPFVRFLTQSIPFLNARIQGLDKLGRAMTKEQRAQLLTVLGTYSLASIGLYLAYKDDEDFKEREQWDRDTYHWFKLPNDAGVFRIPRPFEVGAVGVIFERMVEQMVDDDVHGQLLAERILHVITETFAVDIRPQLITPALEVYSNKDSFTGRPIESLGMKRLPASERKYAYTSSSYVGASKILELIPFEKVQLSPVQIEHLVQGYFGWVGSAVVSAVSIVDYPRKFAEFFTTGFDSPLAMGFFKGLPSLQSKYKTQFYDMRRKMEEVNNLMRLYQKRGEYNKALELAEKNKNLLQWRGAYNKVNTKISQVNQELRRIQADKNLTEKEKLDRTRQLSIVKNDMIQNLTEAVLSWEKTTGQKLKRPIWWK